MSIEDEIWVAAETLNDLERARIALEHRLRTTGLQSVDHDEMLGNLQALEDHWTKALVTAIKQHPLHPWILATKGIGEKTAGRFLGIVPNPAWHEIEERPRTLYELNAYCGLHVDDKGLAPRRRRGLSANWNTNAKTRLYVMAESALKAQGPLCEVYYKAKAKAEASTHNTLCSLCKVDAGTPLKPGHAHKRAMRTLMKAILAEMHAVLKAELVNLDDLDRTGLRAFIREYKLDIKVTRSMSDDDLRAVIAAACEPESEQEAA